MDIWLILILVVHIVTALGIIGLVLLQHGKGADMGAAFGSGSSGSLFGATGSANFLSRTTAALAAIFFLTSLGLAYLATHRPKAGGGVMDTVKEQPALPATTAPAVPTAEKAPAAVAEPATKAADGKASRANEVPK